MPVVARWFQQEEERMRKAEKQDRAEAERRRELERLQPVPLPPKMKVIAVKLPCCWEMHI